MTTVLIDLEGTLVSGKAFNPIPGASALISLFRSHSIPFRIVTNNTTESEDSLIEKLNSVSIPVEKGELISALGILAETLKLPAKIFTIGATALHDTLKSLGHEVNGIGPYEFVVVGGGGELSEKALGQACQAILDDGAKLIGLHKNRLYVDEMGQRTVGVGAIVTALEYATNSASTIVGKPSEFFFQRALSGLDQNMENVWCISDDPYSDLAGARDLGMRTIFVTTGKYAESECAKLGWRPTHVLATLAECGQIVGSISYE